MEGSRRFLDMMKVWARPWMVGHQNWVIIDRVAVLGIYLNLAPGNTDWVFNILVITCLFIAFKER